MRFDFFISALPLYLFCFLIAIYVIGYISIELLLLAMIVNVVVLFLTISFVLFWPDKKLILISVGWIASCRKLSCANVRFNGSSSVEILDEDFTLIAVISLDEGFDQDVIIVDDMLNMKSNELTGSRTTNVFDFLLKLSV